MQLDELVFAVDSTQLEKANKLMQELGISIQALDKKVVDSAKKQAQAEALQAKAAKDSASARLANAKATEAEAKAADTVAKASERKAAATEKATKTSEKQAEATDRATKMLERQRDVTEYLVEGYSRGEAKQLAQLKSLNALSGQIAEYIKLMETQRNLVSDPFDNSTSGAIKLRKELTSLKDALRSNNAEYELTAKQSREFTKDKQRMLEQYKNEQITYNELKKKIREYRTEYTSAASAVNELQAAEKSALNIKKEIASATRQVTQEDERMAAALGAVNINMNKLATDMLVKYDSNLKKMGLSQAEYTKKLAAYKVQLQQVQDQEEKRKSANLARSLSPQLTDIGVSLYSGQAPLTVLLQQGGQIADLFRLSGVEAQNFGKAMRDAFTSMIPVMKTVVVGMGQFAGSVLMDAGRGVVSFTSNVTGMSLVMDKFKSKLAAGGEENFKFIGTLTKMGNAAATVATGGIVALITLLATLAIEYKKIIQSEAALTKALATSGASMALTKDQAVQLAQSFSGVGVGTLKAQSTMSAFAKETMISSSNMTLAMKSITDYSKLTGVSIDDLAKQYSELEKSPVDALIKIAEKTGNVNQESIQLVASLVDQGKMTEAVTEATKIWASSMDTASSEIKGNLSGIESLWMDVKSAMSKVGQEIYDITTAVGESFAPVMKTAWQTVAVLVSEAWFMIKGVAKDIGVIGAAMGAFIRGEFSQIGTIWQEYKSDAAAAKDEHQKLIDSIMKGGKESQKVGAQNKKDNSEAARLERITLKLKEDADDKADKEARKAMSREEARKNFVENRLKDLAKESGLDIEKLRNTKAITDALTKQADLEYKKNHKKDNNAAARQAKKDQEAYNDTLNKSVGLNAAYNNVLESLQRMRAKGALTEEQYVEAVNALILQQPFATKQAKEYNKVQELRNKLMDKADGLGGEYTKTLLMIAEAEGMMQNGKKVFSEEEIEQMRAALERTTPAFKKAQKGIEEYNKSMVALQAEQEKLILNSERLAQESVLSNMSPEAAKVARIELDAVNKSKEEQIRLDKEKKTLEADKDTTPLQKELQVQEAIKNSILAQKNIITEKNQAYNEYLNNLMGSTSDVLGRLNELASASGNISFANAVNSVGSLLTTFDKINAKQEAFNKLRQDAKGDSKKLAEINAKEAQAQIGTYADITKGLKGFFKEGTKGYKTLNTAEKAFRTYEAAMAIKNSILKMAAESNVLALREAADKKSVASAVWASAKIVAEKMKEGLANAYAAITNQGGGDPYTAFARIAAMTAIMAGLGFAVAGGGSDGNYGKGDGKMTYATGKGTVLGDKDATSESIAKSLSILEDVDTLTMQYSYEMLKSLKKIEQTMTGVTSIILRSNGIEASAAGIQEGTKIPGWLGFGLNPDTNLPIIGKLISSLFGTKTTITGQGVYVNDANYQQILNEDITAGYYTDVNKKKKLFGFTTSNRNSTNYTESAELSQQFAKILNGFVDTVKAAGGVLGVTTEDIDAKLADFVLKIGKIDLKDLKGDEIKEKLTSVFGAAGDDIARQALAGFERFQEAGEGYLETIVRVANTVETVRSSMNSMNRSMDITVDNAMALAEALGGVDKYSEATTAYIRSFYSEAEQNEIMTRQLTEALAKHNIALPKTKEEYRALMESQDLTTESGREMYALLLLLAHSFATVADAAQQAADDLLAKAKEISATKYDLETELLRAQGKEQEAVNRERQKELDALNALDPSLGKIKEEIWATQDAANAAADALEAKNKADKEAADALEAAAQARKQAQNDAYSALQKAITAEKELLNTRLTAANTVVSTMTSLFDLLEESIKELYNEVQSTADANYTTARSLIATAATTVRAGGSIEDIPGLTTAINDVMSGLSPDDYSTTVEYDRERLRLAGDLTSLKNTSKKELTVAEQNLAALNDQIAKLDETLKYWEMQVQIAQGTYQATLSVTDAIKALQYSLSSSSSSSGNTEVIGGSLGSGSSSPKVNVARGRGESSWGREAYLPTGSHWFSTSATETARLDKLYDAAFKPYAGTGDIVGYLNAVKASGGTLLDASTLGAWDYADMLAAADRAGIPRFASGGIYSGGLAMVGEEGPELINFNRGGHISNSADTASLLAGSAQRVDVLERAVIVMGNQLSTIAVNTKRSADILRSVSPNGDSISVSPAEEN